MCLTPINLKKETWVQKLSDTYHMQQVPCGRCLECKKLRVDSWFIRLDNELKHAHSAHFVTLTYDEDWLPVTDDGLMSLNYKDHQDYMKRLRKNTGLKDIKYFTVGEYGEIRGRPHYHSILYNCPDQQAVVDAWGKGECHFGKVEDATIFYTLKYALKRAGKIQKNDDGTQMERALMSQGLGLKYLTPAMIKHFKDDVGRSATMLDNKKLSLPRYYRDKIFTKSEKNVRNLKLVPHMEKRYEKISDPMFPQRVEKMLGDQEKKQKKTD